VFWSILQRTILWELVRVFALSLIGITGIMVMAGIVAEATQQGLGPAQILAAIPLLIPSFLPYTIPATTLFTTCVVYGRLAQDNEILAIKAAGIHLRVVVWPAILLGLMMSSVTMGLYYHLIPYTHYLLRSSFLNDAEEYLYTLLKKDRCIKRYDIPYSMWVRQVQGRRLIDALFKRRDKKGQYDAIARAREAELHVDLANKEVLVHMRHCHIYGDNGKITGYQLERVYTVPLPPDFGQVRNLKPRAMGIPEILERREGALVEIGERMEEIQRNEALKGTPEAPPNLSKHLKNLDSALQVRKGELYSLETEFHMRPALAFGCLCFVLVGCPVGMWFSRSDYLSAFITCFLPIVFIYYPLLLCGNSFAKQGKLHAAVAMWMANILMFLIAGVLFRRLLKH
jgi:lipopolysaccharide export system permease protein